MSCFPAFKYIKVRSFTIAGIVLLSLPLILFMTEYNRRQFINVGNIQAKSAGNVEDDRGNSKEHLDLEENTNRAVEQNTNRAVERLYNEIVQTYNVTLKITPYDIVNNYPFWKIMHLPKEAIQFAPNFKNPCFFARTQKKSCGKLDLHCGDVRLKCLPYFFIAGVPKCGTTDLFMRLLPHQQTHFAEKEICWWNGRHDFAENINAANIEKYSQKFETLIHLLTHNGSNDMAANIMNGVSSYITTDACPTYFKMGRYWIKDPLNRVKTSNGTKKLKSRFLVPHRIHHLLPQSKIIFNLREPNAKIMSQYIMQSTNHDREISQEAFHKIVVNEIEWFETCKRLRSEEYCLFNQPCHFRVNGLMKPSKCSPSVVTALYSVYMKVWLEVFPRQNLLFIKFEDYIQNPLDYIGQNVLPFLGLEPYSQEALQRIAAHKTPFNKGHTKIEMWNETRNILANFLKPYNEKLVDLLGEDFKY